MLRRSSIVLRLAILVLFAELFFSLLYWKWWSGDFLLCCLLVGAAVCYRTVDHLMHPDDDR